MDLLVLWPRLLLCLPSSARDTLEDGRSLYLFWDHLGNLFWNWALFLSAFWFGFLVDAGIRRETFIYVFLAVFAFAIVLCRQSLSRLQVNTQILLLQGGKVAPQDRQRKVREKIRRDSIYVIIELIAVNATIPILGALFSRFIANYSFVMGNFQWNHPVHNR